MSNCLKRRAKTYSFSRNSNRKTLQSDVSTGVRLSNDRKGSMLLNFLKRIAICHSDYLYYTLIYTHLKNAFSAKAKKARHFTFSKVSRS